MRTVFFRMLLAVAILMVMAPAAMAQDTLNCPDFEFQEDAQAELDADPSDPHGLDGDNDGMACDDLPRRGGAGTTDPGTTDTTEGTTGSDTGTGETPAGGIPTGAGGTAASGLPSLQLLFGMAGAMGAAGLTALAIKTRRG